tara:strand:- start:72 stop:362 length:291 start_codon:yes stop_codon:yes gene_type:complete
MKLVLKGKRGQQQVGGLQGLVWSLVVLGIMLVVGLIVMGNLISTNLLNETSPAAFEAGNDTIAAIGTLPDWLPVIVTIAVAGIILSLVYYFRRGAE